MLIAPLWILHALQNETVQLSVITVCVSVFVGVLSLSTRANAFESLAAGAACVLCSDQFDEVADSRADIALSLWSSSAFHNQPPAVSAQLEAGKY